jgi:hypothetical protein
MIIAALKLTLMTVVFIGKDKTKLGKAKSCTDLRRRWQNILRKKYPGLLAKERKPLRPSIHGTVSLQMKF